LPGYEFNDPVYEGLFEAIIKGDKTYQGTSIEPITDNRPFPFPVAEHQAYVWDNFKIYGWVLFTTILILSGFIWQQTKKSKRKNLW